MLVTLERFKSLCYKIIINLLHISILISFHSSPSWINNLLLNVCRFSTLFHVFSKPSKTLMQPKPYSRQQTTATAQSRRLNTLRNCLTSSTLSTDLLNHHLFTQLLPHQALHFTLAPGLLQFMDLTSHCRIISRTETYYSLLPKRRKFASK